jgi:DNA-binding MarR family transcriptional regulator
LALARRRPDIELLAQIARIEQRVRAGLEGALPEGLSAAQFTVLGHLVLAGEPQSPGAIAAQFQLSKAAITNTLQRLEAQGFIRLQADDGDGRRKSVTVTAAGAAAHREGLAAVKPQREALRQAFAAQEFEAALPFLRRLRDFLERGATPS